ncbi:unnamed protein product [Acanthocheilonema viteae]|uniref:Uncharacterized protein n=1 Tax=Acanthocheilonema viteae TaxID=6277 RepID=A0A498S4V0_ACAVI|nr:unnamed protein product [Acanthocheilonema viteae]
MLARYVFPCLDECQCDTDDEVIYCHNGHRTTLELPEIRLRGFIVIGLTNNAIKKLPNEKSLLELFPDLMAIDVEGNAQFDCESLKEYKEIKIYSDCNGTEMLVTRNHRLPNIQEQTDVSFIFVIKNNKALYNTAVFHLYRLNNRYMRLPMPGEQTLQNAVQLSGEIMEGKNFLLKTKYNDIDKDKIVKDVKDFFVNIAKKIDQLHMK